MGNAPSNTKHNPPEMTAEVPTYDDLKAFWLHLNTKDPTLYTDWKATTEEDDNTVECPICYETVTDDATVTNCSNGHVAACAACTQRIVSVSRPNTRCTVCRRANTFSLPQQQQPRPRPRAPRPRAPRPRPRPRQEMDENSHELFMELNPGVWDEGVPIVFEYCAGYPEEVTGQTLTGMMGIVGMSRCFVTYHDPDNNKIIRKRKDIMRERNCLDCSLTEFGVPFITVTGIIA